MKFAKKVLLVVCAVSTFLAATGRFTPEIAWMKQLVDFEPCLQSLVGVVDVSKMCTPWSRRETASPLPDPKRGLVYIGGQDKKLHVLSARTGKLLRALALPAPLAMRPHMDKEGALYFGLLDGKLLKVDSFTLQIVWQKQLDAELLRPVVTDEKGRIYVLSGLSTLYAIDKKSGKIVWLQAKAPPLGLTIRKQSEILILKPSAETYPSGALMVGYPDGSLAIYSLKNGKLERTENFGKQALPFPDITAGPILGNKTVFLASFNAGLFAQDPSSGMVLWNEPIDGIVQVKFGKDIIFAANASKVMAFNASNGNLIWTFQFKKGAPTNLVIKGKHLYAATDLGPIVVLEKKTGRPVASLGSRLGYASDLVFSEATLFAMSSPGALYAVSAELGSIFGNSYSK